MKFTKEHYEILKSRIAALDITTLKNAKQTYKNQGFSERRYYMDVFWATKTVIGNGAGLSSNCGIEGDYNDDHIFTATKKAVDAVIAESES